MGKFSIMKLMHRRKADDKTELIVEDAKREIKNKPCTVSGHMEFPTIQGSTTYNKLKEIEDSKAHNEIRYKKEKFFCFQWKSKDQTSKEKIPVKPPNKDIERVKNENSIFRVIEQRKGRGSKSVSHQSKFLDSRPQEDITSYGSIEGTHKNGRIIDVGTAFDVMYVGNGSALVTDSNNSKLLMFDSRGNSKIVYHTKELLGPSSLVLTTMGEIAITSSKNKCVVVLSQNGEVVKCFGHDVMHWPSGIAISKNGAFIVTDVFSRQILIFDKAGKFLKYLHTAGHTFICPRFITVSPEGAIIISDTGANCLKVFNENGKFLRVIGKYGSADGQLRCPYGIKTDVAGNILVADHGNNRVSLFDPNGHFLCHILTSKQGIMNPQGISLSPDLTIFVTYGSPSSVKIAAFKIKSPAK